MLKATQDFAYAGIEIKAEQEIEPYTFEADDVQSLIRQGLVIDTDAKPAKEPAPKKIEDAPKVSHRSKTK